MVHDNVLMKMDALNRTKGYAIGKRVRYSRIASCAINKTQFISDIRRSIAFHFVKRPDNVDPV